MSVKVADEAWIALAKLHRKHPERQSFRPQEVVQSARQLGLHTQLRPGVQTHVYKHAVANVAPTAGRYRMFYRLDDGSVRLFRPGDIAHPNRRGKITPKREEIPAEYQHLLDWYERKYAEEATPPRPEDDPILQLVGLGKEIWEGIDADEYIRELRSGWEDETDPDSPSAEHAEQRRER
jgi:hypothetical protein